MNPDERKVMYSFRATTDEIGGLWMRAAEKAGMSVSQWIRDALDSAARRELDE